jgi:hypothetical protein
MVVSYGQYNNEYAEGIFWKQGYFEGIMVILIPGSNIRWLIFWCYVKEHM